MKRMSQKESNKKDDNVVEQQKDSVVVAETKPELSAEKQSIENDLRVSMNALNFMSTKIDGNRNELISLEEKIFPKKVPNYKVYKHYIKGEKLGTGSYATVREFVDQKSLKRVAGKIIKKEVLFDKNSQYYYRTQRIKRNVEKEFCLVGKLSHINVIKLFDTYETMKKIYLFMEYGIAVLEEFLVEASDHKLPKWQCHRYYTHIIEGLDYLHSNGIIHRDIKPENLIVDTSDVIKIGDFGVCHIVDWFAPNDHMGTGEGTGDYWPPEVWDENTRLYIGTQLDIWASAVILYRMVFGKFPFKSTDSIIQAKLEYPNEIYSDAHLWYLFNGIFIKDFNKRLSIEDIKKHGWFISHYPPNCKPVCVPLMEFGDIYRSMTVLPRLEYHYYIQSSPEQALEDELVSVEEDEVTRHPKYRISPTIRSNRKLKFVRSPQRSKNPARRVLFGFL